MWFNNLDILLSSRYEDNLFLEDFKNFSERNVVTSATDSLNGNDINKSQYKESTEIFKRSAFHKFIYLKPGT